MKTKPRGIHATFESTCWKCAADITITNGRPAPHECERPMSAVDMGAWQDAMGDYYDSGAIGDPPPRPRSLSDIKF